MGPELLWAAFLSAAAIQIIYLLFIFGRLAYFFKFPNAEDSPQEEGVSIVVAARDEAPNLRKLIPLLSEQQYPRFEILVLNDRSTDETQFLLEQMMGQYPRLRTVTVRYTPPHLNSKKYALTLGIKTAKYDIILLTDADCRPISEKWVQLMSRPVRADGKIFALGYGGYDQGPGFLNRLIQFETLLTAISYFSFAIWKSPYMGVGRNLCYRKSFFLEKKAFKNLWHINGGDDDLFINRYANGNNTAAVIHPDSITLSGPKIRWSAYYAQKKRHFHAGRFYNTKSKLKIGAYMLSNFIFWLSAFLLLISVKAWEPIAMLLGLTLIRALIQMVVFSAAKKKLEGGGNVYWVMFFDLVYLSYFWVLGARGYLSKEVKWK